MFLIEWREFPSAPCLPGKTKKLDEISRLDFVEIARFPDILRACFRLGQAKDLSALRCMCRNENATNVLQYLPTSLLCKNVFS